MYSSNSSTRPMGYVDHGEMAYQARVAKHPLVATCINNVIDQLVSQQSNTTVSVGKKDFELKWMDEQFRSMSNESYREGLWDMVVHGIMMFSYHPVSKGIPPMVIDSPTDSIEIQALGVKDRVMYADKRMEDDRNSMKTFTNISESVEKVAYIIKRENPLSFNIKFTIDASGKPEEFVVTPLASNLVNSREKVDPNKGLKNIRVFVFENTFPAEDFTSSRNGGKPWVNSRKDMEDARSPFSLFANSSWGAKKPFSMVSIVAPLVESLEHLDQNSLLTIHRGVFPPFSYVKMGESKHDVTIGDLKAMGLSAKDAITAKAFFNEADTKMVTAGFDEKKKQFAEHLQILQLGSNKKGASPAEWNDYYLSTFQKLPWALQMAHVMTPGWDIKFWPTVKLGKEELEEKESIREAIAAVFGQALTNLNGSGVNARQAPGQMVALSKYLIKPVLTNFNIGIVNVFKHVIRDSTKAAFIRDVKENIKAEIGERRQRSAARREKRKQQQQQQQEPTTAMSVEESVREDVLKSDAISDDALGIIFGLKPKPASTALSKWRNLFSADEDLSSSSSESEEEEGESEQAKKERRQRRKPLQQIVDEFMNSLSIKVEVISPLAEIDDMEKLVNLDAVDGETVKLWASTRYSLPQKKGPVNLPSPEGAEEKKKEAPAPKKKAEAPEKKKKEKKTEVSDSESEDDKKKENPKKKSKKNEASDSESDDDKKKKKKEGESEKKKTAKKRTRETSDTESEDDNEKEKKPPKKSKKKKDDDSESENEKEKKKTPKKKSNEDSDSESEKKKNPKKKSKEDSDSESEEEKEKKKTPKKKSKEGEAKKSKSKVSDSESEEEDRKRKKKRRASSDSEEEERKKKKTKKTK